MSKQRQVSESVKNTVAGLQFFKCANKSGSNLANTISRLHVLC